MDKTIEQMIAVAPGGEAVSREGALHKAVCEAVIHLNIGENFQASHILRAALVEYADHQAQQPAAAVPVRVTPRDGKWVYSDNDEVFRSFDHETELSAITDALDYYADASTIYVGQVKTLDVRRMIRADYILENISERAYDDVGEEAEHWPELSKDQQTELEGIIADYILSKSPADFYSVENMRTYTREQAEAMLAAAIAAMGVES